MKRRRGTNLGSDDVTVEKCSVGSREGIGGLNIFE